VNVVFTVVFVVPLLKRSNLSEEKRARKPYQKFFLRLHSSLFFFKQFKSSVSRYTPTVSHMCSSSLTVVHVLFSYLRACERVYHKVLKEKNGYGKDCVLKIDVSL